MQTESKSQPGSLSSLEAPSHIQSILELFQDEIRTRLMHHKTVDQLSAVRYAISIKKGTVYYIKAQIGKNQFIHVKLAFSLPDESGVAQEPILEQLVPDRKLNEPFILF